MEMYFAPRLNIITGDNGLGKTFIMDCAWWALTGKWIDSAALPKERRKSHKSSIAYGISGRSQRNKQTIINYDEKKKVWPRTDSTPTIPGLIVYARVDGSYAVWDPIKQYDISPAPFSFSNEEVWYGKHENGQTPSGTRGTRCSEQLQASRCRGRITERHRTAAADARCLPYG